MTLSEGISKTVYPKNENIKEITIKNLDIISGRAFANCEAEACRIQNVGEITIDAFDYGRVNLLEVKNIDKLVHSFWGLLADEYYATDIGEYRAAVPRGAKHVEIIGIKKMYVDYDTSIGISSECSIKSLTLKGNIENIEGYETYQLTSLETMTLESPYKVQWILGKIYENRGWFYDCVNLKDVYLKCGGVDESIQGVFPAGITLHVPAEQVEEYKKYVTCNVVAW